MNTKDAKVEKGAVGRVEKLFPHGVTVEVPRKFPSSFAATGFYSWAQVAADLRGKLHVGDAVTMEYLSTPAFGLWFVKGKVEGTEHEAAYGLPLERMVADLEVAREFYRCEERGTSGWGMLACSILSDSQEEIERGNAQRARQLVNRAKWIIVERIKGGTF